MGVRLRLSSERGIACSPESLAVIQVPRYNSVLFKLIMSKSKKEVLIAASDAEFGSSLRDALAAIAGEQIEPSLIDFLSKKKLAKNTEGVLAFHPSMENNLHEWLWLNLRHKNKNPVLVFGFETEDDFCSEYPVFDGKYGDHDHHCYIRIPFKITDLKAALLRLQPLTGYDLEDLKWKYATDKEFIYEVILHKVGSKCADYTDTFSRIAIARQYFKKQNATAVMAEIDARVKEIKKLSNPDRWEIAFSLAEYLREQLENMGR